ncbi:hypothetical protein PCE1_002781 [Barthelona sp. PCE]
MSILIRLCEPDDFNSGHLSILGQLSDTVSNISKDKYSNRLTTLYSQKCFVFVAIDNRRNREDRIVGSATIMLESKLIHECGAVGHIEDVVVREGMRGLGIGRLLVAHLINFARQNGAYKCILDCATHNIPFYKRCGLETKEHHMAMYFE